MQNTLAFRATQGLRSQNAALTDLALILLGSLVVAGLAQVSIPLVPVPVTGQTLAVLLIGMVFGARRGAATLALYVAEGAAGLPVFSNLGAGMGHLLGPTGGYLIGFIVAAYVVGLLAERGASQSLVSTFGAFVIGSAIIYLLGIAWLSTLIGLDAALVNGLYPFLLGDALKALLAAMLLPAAWKFLGSS